MAQQVKVLKTQRSQSNLSSIHVQVERSLIPECCHLTSTCRLWHPSSHITLTIHNNSDDNIIIIIPVKIWRNCHPYTLFVGMLKSDCHRNTSLTYKEKHTCSSSPTFGYVTKRNEVRWRVIWSLIFIEVLCPKMCILPKSSSIKYKENEIYMELTEP